MDRSGLQGRSYNSNILSDYHAQGIIRYMYDYLCFFFFQAEDGIRDVAVTGVQTCALPIFRRLRANSAIPRPRVPRTPFRRSCAVESAKKAISSSNSTFSGWISCSSAFREDRKSVV